MVAISDGAVRKIVEGAVNGDVSISRDDAVLAFVRQSLSRPAEVYVSDGQGRETRALTHVNDELFADIDVRKPESVTYAGAEGETKSFATHDSNAYTVSTTPAVRVRRTP
jgi:dipeptidyl aminopeptidase/acylaminoacyl peptidase